MNFRATAFLFGLLVVILGTTTSSASESLDSRRLAIEDFRRTEEYYQECLRIREMRIKDSYTVDCYTNYHHYNSDVAKDYREDQNFWVEMAAFNVWQPGSNASPFKDYSLVAKIMNGFDLVAASELLPAVGDDLENNQRVLSFIEDAPGSIEVLERRFAESGDQEIGDRLQLIKDDLAKAPSLYRLPGYLHILEELRKLDPSWSLILAPSGESADDNFVQELVGFYYRGRKVRPKVNEHCHKFRKKRHGTSYACYPKLTKAWAGESIRGVFSRRPFMGSFESGSFDFTLVTSHIVFNASDDAATMERILQPSFGVSDYRELGTGANKETYARLAEMKVIMDIMNKVRSESREKDIIFLGDTNLEYSNPQWEKVLSAFPGGELFIDEPTTLTMPYRLSDGTLTMGSASDYDHIVMDLDQSSECRKANGDLSAKVGNFITGRLKKFIDDKYRYRMQKSFVRDPRREDQRQTLLSEMRERLLSRETIKRGRVVIDDREVEETLVEFDERVFLSQIDEDNYYKVYRDVISDHFPVYFSCKQ